jgi:nitroreductase
MTENSKKTLEQIIKSRCSTRSFSTEELPIDYINEIIQSCVYAPYANPIGLPYHEIRKIFIFRQNTDSMSQVRDILFSQIKKYSKIINTTLKVFPFLRKKLRPFADKLFSNSQNGIPALFDAPYFIVIAEKKGFPSNQKQSISHSLQNMWLTATNIGLGFQMIFMATILSKSKQFLKLLDLKNGEYIIDGCVIGYPLKPLDTKKEYKIDEFVTWIK